MVRSRYHFLGIEIYLLVNKFEKDEARPHNNLLLPRCSIIERYAISVTLQSRYVLETMSLVVCRMKGFMYSL